MVLKKMRWKLVGVVAAVVVVAVVGKAFVWIDVREKRRGIQMGEERLNIAGLGLCQALQSNYQPPRFALGSHGSPQHSPKCPHEGLRRSYSLSSSGGNRVERRAPAGSWLQAELQQHMTRSQPPMCLDEP